MKDYGYCGVCGTKLTYRTKVVENTSGYGQGYYKVDVPYCPHCEAVEEEKKRAKEEEEARRKREKEEKERRERHSEYLKRLEKYKKYMPKKVTAVVLTYQEAKLLHSMVSKEVFNLTANKDIKNDNLYVAKVLKDKFHKAIEETDYAYSDVGEFAKEKGWEKDDNNKGQDD